MQPSKQAAESNKLKIFQSVSERIKTIYPIADHKQPNLLIVDDEVNVTRSLARSLRDLFVVYTANSAKEALGIIDKVEINVVLTDQRMPDMTGVELLKEIREKDPRIIGIILSGYSDSTALVEALNLGSVRGFIPKPWDINTLKEKLLETVRVFEHLVTENAGLERQPAGINQQTLDELKRFFEFINSMDLETAFSADLKLLVQNPYSESMSNFEYLNQLQDGFALVQNNGQFIFYNPAFRRFLTSTKNTPKDFKSIDDLKEFSQFQETIRLGLAGKQSHFDSELTSLAGKPIYVDTSVTPFLGKEQQYHVVIAIHDQTEKEKRISYLKSINEVALALNNHREFIDGLESALCACADTFNVDAAVFYGLASDGQSFTYEGGTGLNAGAVDFLKNQTDRLKISNEKPAVENANGFALWDVNQEAMPIFPNLVSHQRIQSAAFTRIYEQEKLIGLLALYSHATRDFEEDLLLISAIGSQIGTAKTNARLKEELLKQARMDVITGLSNRRYFFEIAERYFTRGKFIHSPLAVFMVDADNFKQINDLYGHLVGDQALNAIAALLNNCIRPSDLICRYGGDEFILLIPGCDNDMAEQITWRILAQFNTYRLPVGDLFIQLSVSIGFAITNLDRHETLEGLLNQADERMYLNKRGKTLMLSSQ